RGHIPVHTKTVNKKTGQLNYSLNGEQLLKMATGYSTIKRDVPPAIWDRPTRHGYTRSKDGGALIRKPDPLAKAVLEFKAADQTISSFLEVYERHWVEESK